MPSMMLHGSDTTVTKTVLALKERRGGGGRDEQIGPHGAVPEECGCSRRTNTDAVHCPCGIGRTKILPKGLALELPLKVD